MLIPGRNCWRVEHSDRFAFLVDAADYFAAVRAAIARARRTVFILGWDIDTSIRLVPQGANDGYPEELGEFLKEVVRRNRRLHMYVLSSDFAMVFGGDREWFPLYKLGWREGPRPRLHFKLDARHPPSGSHHQKVVVVDDAVAFVGGLDLTHGRWDTREHQREQPYRRDKQGRISRPNHDVQAIVDGNAARALGELCRERWQRLGKRTIPLVDAADDPWPRNVIPEATDLQVAIARSDPAGRPGPRWRRYANSTWMPSPRRAARCTSRTSTSARASSAHPSRSARTSPIRPTSWSSRASPRKAGWRRARWARCARACTSG